jgi:selenide,water dikinase
LAIIENVDVFTPIHDDPFIQGEIVACNSTNDVFAMGSTDVVSLQAFLGYPKEMPEEIAVGVLKGMNSFMNRLGAKVTGGQTIKNPWPVFGGICLGIIHPKDIVYSRGAIPGDIAILTKPLGIQPSMRSYRDLQDENRESLVAEFDERSLKEMQKCAVRVMTTSNLEAAQAMKHVGVNAATDITGFGLLGHAENVATQSGVDIVIDRMPVIKGTLKLADFFGHKLSSGRSAETAGGMLVFMPHDKEEKFRKFLSGHNLPCWTIGKAAAPRGKPSATLAEDVEYNETEFP